MNTVHPFLRGALALSPLRPAFWLQGELGIANRTVRRWLSSEEAPPLAVAEKMVTLLRDRAREADMAANAMEILIATGSLRKSEKVEPTGPLQNRESAVRNPHSEVERAHRRRLGLSYEE